MPPASPPECAAVAKPLALAAALSMMMGWLIPNHYLPWSWFYNECAMAIALLLLFFAAWPHVIRSGVPGVACVTAGLVLVPWLQWSVGLLHFSGDAWVSTFYLLCLALAISTGFAWTRNSPHALAAVLSATTLVAGLASSMVAMLRCLQIGDFGIWVFEVAPGDRAVANLAQPNDLALLLGLAVLGLWCLRMRRYIGRAAAVALLVPLLIGSAMTQSRTALLFGPVLIVVLLANRTQSLRLREQVPTVVGAVVMQIFLVWLWPIVSAALLLAPTYSLADTGLKTGRSVVWPVLLDAIWQSPWVGYGWLQTGAAQLAAAERHPPSDELFLHGHNILLDLVVWCGLPLGLLLAGALLAWFIRRVRRAASTESQIGMMAVALFGTHAMLELPHHFLFFLVPIGLWIGLVERGLCVPAVGPARAALPLAGLTLVTGVLLASAYPAVESDFRLMRFAEVGIGTGPAAASNPAAPFLSTLTASIRLARTPARAGMSAAELADMEAIVTRYPFSPALFRYACALALNGQGDKAVRTLVKLRHIYGEARYMRLRRALHRQVVEGQAGLRSLDRELPD